MARIGLLPLLLLAFLYSSARETKNIREALSEKLVSCRITGRWDPDELLNRLDSWGQYYGKCMYLRTANKSDDTLYLTIQDGLLLMSDDTSVQDMLITCPVYVTLSPRQVKVTELYAMCTEMHNAGPDMHTTYRFGNQVDSSLMAITRAIEELYMQNFVGQSAVWAYTDEASKLDLAIYGATDSSLAMTRKVLARAGVSTKHFPLQTMVTGSVKTDTSEILSDTVPQPDSSIRYISIDQRILLAGCGVLVLLFGTSVMLIIRRNREKTE